MDTKIDNMQTSNQNKVERTPIKAKANQETEQQPLVFNVLCAKSKRLKASLTFEEKTVEIKTDPQGRIPPKFIIDGSPRNVKCFGKLKTGGWNGRFRISIKFKNTPKTLWFSLTKTEKYGEYDPVCIKMLKKAHEVFPKLRKWNLEKKLEGIKEKIDAKHAAKSGQGDDSNEDDSPPDEGRRRLTSRYDNHFPPFVRTCQEILDALDDAGVDY